jgi:hypothetical protein
MLLALAISMALAQPGLPTTLPLLCQADLPAVGGYTIAWVNLLVDGDYRPLSSAVFVRMNGFDAEWNLGGKGFSAPGTMISLSYNFPLPADSAYPVKVALTVDGRTTHETTYAAPPGNSGFSSDALGHRVYAVEVGRGEISNVFGAKRMSIRAVDSKGALITNEKLDLPNWTWLQRESQKAAQAAERQRHSKMCGPSAFI